MAVEDFITTLLDESLEEGTDTSVEADTSEKEAVNTFDPDKADRKFGKIDLESEVFDPFGVSP